MHSHQIVEALELHTTRLHAAHDAADIAAAEERSRNDTHFDRAAELNRPMGHERSWTHDYQEGTSGMNHPSQNGEAPTANEEKEVDRNPYHRLSASNDASSGFVVPNSASTGPGGLPPLQQGVVYGEPDSFSDIGTGPSSPSAGVSGSSQGGSRTARSASESFIPLAPSSKALGKLRRVSVRSNEDNTGAQSQLEEQLRAKYEQTYEEEMRSRDKE